MALSRPDRVAPGRRGALAAQAARADPAARTGGSLREGRPRASPEACLLRRDVRWLADPDRGGMPGLPGAGGTWVGCKRTSNRKRSSSKGPFAAPTGPQGIITVSPLWEYDGMVRINGSSQRFPSRP